MTVETVTLKLPSEIVDVIRKYAKRIIVDVQAQPVTNIENDNVPTLDDVAKECIAINSAVNPERFFSYYTARNWLNKDGTTFDWKQKLKEWGGYNLEKTTAPAGKQKKTYDMSVKAADVRAFMEGL